LYSTSAWSQNASQLPTPTEVFKKVSPAVVLVFAGNEKTISQSTSGSQGTGFLVSSDGRIVTNYHVIAHMKVAGVRLASGDVYDVVDIVDVDKRRDLVILKIKAVELPYLTLGKSGNIEVGSKVYTITHPRMLLDNTLSEGIVSALPEGNGVRQIQITAPISHGSSGGPVFDNKGNVIAVVQATFDDAQNVNFSIPIEYVKGLLTTTGTQPLSAIYEPPPPSENATTPPPSPSPNPEPKTPAGSPPASTVETGPSSATLYIKCVGGSAGAVSQFGTGTSPANFVPYLNSLPASCPTPEVPIGTVTAATQTLPSEFGIHTVWQGRDYWAFSTGTDQASKVAFTDVNNSLGMGGSIVQQTGTHTMVWHLNDAAHYMVGSDEANNILIQFRLVADESQPATTSRTSDAKPETIDGSWSATVADSKASGRLEFNLIQNSDGQVVGTYTSSLGGGGKIKGQLTEIDFRFELTQTIEGCPGIYKGTGTRIGDHIAGSYTGNDCLGDRGNGSFTMTRGTNAEPIGHSASSGRTSSVSPIPDEMRKSVGDFLATRLLVWSEQDARTVMGEPLSHRFAYDQARSVTGDIYTFRDPTLNADHIELSFDSKTNRLTNVYLYPGRLTTWEDCKKLWGKDATVAIKNPDGSKIYSYKNRHVTVLLDKNNRVINLGLF
jgi:hypothetical protein